MGRLTKRGKDGTVFIDKRGFNPCIEFCRADNCNYCITQKAFTKLAHYEDMEEQLMESAEIDIDSMVGEFMHYYNLQKENRLIELPCAVGDEYWCTERGDGGEGPVIHKVHSEPFACLVKDLWGIKCFATKEEAEKKLQEI